MGYHVQAAPPGAGFLSFDAIEDLVAWDSTKQVPGLVVSVLADGTIWMWYPTGKAAPAHSTTTPVTGGVYVLLTRPFGTHP